MHAPIYMDHHATTPVDPKVLEAMLPYFTEKFGNPASRQHSFGWIAEEAVERSRASIADAIGALTKEIIFTSGATEANNLAIKGAVEALRQKGSHCVTVQTEHKSVLDCFKKLERSGSSVTYLPVNDQGMLDPERLRSALTDRTVIVSVMAANSEIGTLHPLSQIGRICRERGIWFHTDATQAAGKIPIDVEAMNIDMLSFSGHKIYGPKGIGVLYVRSSPPRVRPKMQIDGGGHEGGMRSGTLNVPGIVGLAKALEVCITGMSEESRRVRSLRDGLLEGFMRGIEGVILNGHPTERLPNNLNVSFLGAENDALMMSMKEVAVSTGSACSTADPEPSHVLKALRLPPERVHSAVRFGLGRFNTEEEVSYVVGRVSEGVANLRKLSTAYNKPKQPLLSH